MCVVVVIDQLTKIWAVRNLAFFQEKIIVPKVLSFELVYNYGAAYGIFSNQRLFLLTLSIVIIGLALVFSKHLIQSKWSLYGLLFILAGAAGNVIDRAFLGYVVDFIYIRIVPNFNVADMLINIGAFCFIAEMFTKKHDRS